MSFSDLRPELAVSLDQLVPDENVPQRWADVLERVGRVISDNEGGINRTVQNVGEQVLDAVIDASRSC